MKRKSFISALLTVAVCIILSGCSGAKPEEDTAPEAAQEESEEQDTKDSKKDKKKDKKKKDWASLREDDGEGEDEGGDVYAPILEEVKDILENGFDQEKHYKYISDGIRERAMYPEGDDLADVIGYYLKDINGDGIDELLIGENDVFEYGSPNKVNYVYSGFTVKNNKPVCFLEGWARNRQHYLGDGSFLNTGSGGASNTMFGEWHLEPEGTEPVWDDFYYTCDDMVEGGLVIYNNKTGEEDVNASKKLDITEDEFYEMIDDRARKIDAIAWTPVGNDQNGGIHIVNTMTDDELISYEKKLNSLKYYGFLHGDYSDPRDIEWDEVFYVGAGFDQGTPSAKICKAYLKATGEDEIYTDLTTISGDDVRSFVKETTGLDYSEMNYPLDFTYLKDYDLYINEHGDTNQSSVSVTAGMMNEGNVLIAYERADGFEYVVTFKDNGGKYQFISNLQRWMVEDPTNGGDVDQSMITDGMIIPDSDARNLSEDDLRGLSAEELRIARNEIYARHGRKFADKELQAHFDSMEWYSPTVEAKDFDESILNEYELFNLKLIGKFEKKAK